jgi:hypothetical protein
MRSDQFAQHMDANSMIDAYPNLFSMLLWFVNKIEK